MQQTPHQRKTLTERVIHAITFEGLATLILAPTAAWLMQRSVVEMGGLSILLATEDFFGRPDFSMVCFKVEWDKRYYELSHRDILGA